MEDNGESSEERVQNRAVEHTVAVPRPQITERIDVVMQIAKIIDCVDVPMPPGEAQDEKSS